MSQTNVYLVESEPDYDDSATVDSVWSNKNLALERSAYLNRTCSGGCAKMEPVAWGVIKFPLNRLVESAEEVYE